MFNVRKVCIVLKLLVFALQQESVIGKHHSTSKCGNIDIQFPFHLRSSKFNQTNNDESPCGYHLLCNHANQTVLEIPAVPINFFVKEIHYLSRTILIYDPEQCLATQLLKLGNASITPFNFLNEYIRINNDVSVFDCHSTPSCPVLRPSVEGIADDRIISCTKVKDVLSARWFFSYFYVLNVSIQWATPNCPTNLTHKSQSPVVFIATGGVFGFILLMMLLVTTSIYMHRYYEMKGQDQARIEKFLEDYRAMKPMRFSYADIKRITNRFSESLGEGAHGTVFKGMISREILVAVKVLNDTVGDGKDFINEVGIIGKIHHVNIVRLLGFCADGFHRALVYDFFPNGSLQRFLGPPDNRDVAFLGWENLLQIALGVAKGIEYLHLGCDHRILHFDINPHNVLLDDQLVPKITDFGLAKLCPKNRSTVSMTAAKGTLGYIAPEVFSRNFGNVSYKSDIYSFGMLLLEMVGGRKNTNVSTVESFQVLYPEWIHNLVEGNDIQVTIEGEGDVKIAKKLAIVGLWCIQWNPIDRPSMKTVVQMLEGDGNELIAPPTPFDTSSSSRTNVIVPARRQNFELEVIHEIEE